MSLLLLLVDLLPYVGLGKQLIAALTGDPQWIVLFGQAAYTVAVSWTLAYTVGPRIVKLTDTEYDDYLLDKVTTVLGWVFKIMVAVGGLNPKLKATMDKAVEKQKELERNLQQVG